jgi:hypothetical protein
VSPMGHRLNHLPAPEEDEVDLDREEMHRLATREEEDEMHDPYYGESFRSAASDSNSTVVTKNTNVMIYNRPSMLGMSQQERNKQKFEDQLASPKLLKFLTVLFIALLLFLCLLFTFVNLQSKSYESWIEPNKDSYTNEGIDWAPGDDAPPPLLGAEVSERIEDNIANWAIGTLRIPSTASVDGYGSVALSESASARDVPLFFGKEYTGLNMLDSLLGQCLNLVQASNPDMSALTQEDEKRITLVYSDGRKYVNVDTTTVEGIDRAFALGLVSSGLADVIYSPLVHDASSLFSPENQARLFVIMRHPVEAQFARLRFLRGSSSSERHEELMKLSYEEFADSDFVDDNWMTRALVNKVYGEVLTPTDMATAKEILRRKAIVGWYIEPYISFKKFARYFNWDQLRTGGYFTVDTEECFQSMIKVAENKDEGLGDLNDAETKEGSKAWETIMERNLYDYELYMYGQYLYRYQLGLS